MLRSVLCWTECFFQHLLDSIYVQFSSLWFSFLWIALVSWNSQIHLVSAIDPLGSAKVLIPVPQPGNSPKAVSHLVCFPTLKVTVLYYLMSSILKTVVSCLCLFHYFIQENKSGPFYSIFATEAGILSIFH